THWKVTGWEPNRREVIEVTSKPFSPTLTYLFEPADGGTKFTRQIDVEAGGFFKIVMPLMRRMMRKQNAQFLQNLKKVLEG
ncbi:MAG: SRPBCC family protein, partial [Actinomycetota bacterium]